MTTQEKLIRNKLSLIELAEYLQNVSQACRINGVSRQHFYDIKKVYAEEGIEGLREKSRKKSCLKNRVSPEIEEAVVNIEASYSFVTDTPDFWRRQYAHYPEHGQRFTGEPAYFKHISTAGERLMQELGVTAADFEYAVFHQPNAKFPQRVGQMLGFSPEQIQTGLLVPVIGNTYAGAALIGLTAVLDVAKPGDRILMVSFGSGAGSDAFMLRVTERIADHRDAAPKTADYIARRTEIDYATYARYRGKLLTE